MQLVLGQGGEYCGIDTLAQWVGGQSLQPCFIARFLADKVIKPQICILAGSMGSVIDIEISCEYSLTVTTCIVYFQSCHVIPRPVCLVCSTYVLIADQV